MEEARSRSEAGRQDASARKKSPGLGLQLGFPSWHSRTGLSSCSPMSHALLLRLFLSPSFFSVHVALQYLRIYADNIGITYYLTGRLRELDTQELREVWGFLW